MMKSKLSYSTLLLAVFYGACSNNPDPRGDPAYQSGPAVTAGNFLRYDSIARAPTTGRQSALNIPGIRIGRWPEGAGAFQANGRLTATGTNTFRFVGEKQDTLARKETGDDAEVVA